MDERLLTAVPRDDDSPGPAWDWLSGEAAPPGRYDELRAPDGSIRPKWTRLVHGLSSLGPQELSRRADQARRMILENGVSYNAFSDQGPQPRAWELDPIPLVISSDEWVAVSQGVAQRARLLNRLLVDLYGPQRMLSEGLFPSDLLFSSPAFLRPCHRLSVPGDVFLHFYAADLVRGPDGRWMVLADHTECPLGAGYALENRIIVSSLLAEVFHDCQVQRLAPFFITLRETLAGLSADREHPRTALLTAGPSNETYFEDAYLARYLGYTLVEGADLTVRDSRVYLKTLGGLTPVDVLLRRLPDADCDPLELSTDSYLGVAGLVEAARTGGVVVANALGSGLLESRAVLPYLGVLCRRLLGDDLRLPSVDTVWCGRAEGMAKVASQPDAWAVAELDPPWGMEVLYDRPLGGSGLAARVAARPREWVGQARIHRSTAPIWTGEQARAARVGLRVFAVASQGQYAVMPGGLVLAAPLAEGEAQTGSRPTRLGSKDAWILSAEPVAPVSLLSPAGQPIALRRTGNDLPSRVADNVYWLGRLAERSENAARLLRAVVVRLTSEQRAGAILELPILLRAMADQGQIEPGYVVEGIREQLPAVEEALPQAIFDESQPGSLRATLTSLSQVASIVRDRLSLDGWRSLARIDQEFRPPGGPMGFQLADVQELLNALVLNLAAFSGLALESMTRGNVWRFLDMGRRIERGLAMASLLRSGLVEVEEPPVAVFEALLQVADSTMTYRSRYLAQLQFAPVLDLLLTDETNPRSLAFQLVALSEHVHNLPRDPSRPFASFEERVMISLLANLRLLDVESLGSSAGPAARSELDRLLKRITAQLPKLSDAVTHRYFMHAAQSQQLSDAAPEPLM